MFSSENPVLTIITPAFNEYENLRELHQNLEDCLSKENISWEWIIVDDHSTDESFDKLTKEWRERKNIRLIRLSKNEGPTQQYSVDSTMPAGNAI